MNPAHIHLLLNHFPTIGFGIGMALYLVGYWNKSDDLKRASLVIFFLIAVIAIPTYVSGAAAEEKFCPIVGGENKCEPGISLMMIHKHEDAALLAFSLMEITGFFAWIGLWQLRRTSKLPGWLPATVLVLSLITFGVMAQAANIGGEVRHPEIQTKAEIDAAAVPGPAIARELGSFVISKTWVWPTCETLHFVGLCLLFTAVLFVNLRILGLAKSVPFSALYQVLPIGIVGFGINLVTGMLFFLAAPQQYTSNVEFHRKMIFILLAGFNALYFMLFDKAWKLGEGQEAAVSSKLVAASAIFLWVGVLYYGHMLPFLGNAF